MRKDIVKRFSNEFLSRFNEEDIFNVIFSFEKGYQKICDYLLKNLL